MAAVKLFPSAKKLHRGDTIGSFVRGTEGSNPVPSSGESDELGGRRIGVLPPWIFGHGGKETLLHHSIPLTTRTSPMNRPKISRVINSPTS
jgi:hypothetical protein